jgi:hypothetical protein
MWPRPLIACVLCGVTLLGVPTRSTILHVPGDYGTIQSAIIAAAPDDTVLVQPGTYNEVIDYVGKPILVGSLYVTTGDTAWVSQTIIDAHLVIGASVVRFSTAETRRSRLSGVTVTGGSAAWGGGIRCDSSSPTLDHLRVVANSAAEDGGGIWSGYGAPLVTACTIAGNAALEYDGGGIFAWDSEIEIDGNEIRDNYAYARGAGIYCENSRQIITSNLIAGNRIDTATPHYSYGGGIASRNCDPVITGNTITGNEGGGYGGGIFY